MNFIESMVMNKNFVFSTVFIYNVLYNTKGREKI